MTTLEFSNEFDTLVNAYYNLNKLSEGVINLNFNEYEKSIFLTKAQEDMILEFYNNKNPFKDSFEKTEEIRRYLSILSKTEKITIPEVIHNTGLAESNSYFYKLPEDLWFITMESAKLTDQTLGIRNDIIVNVIPIAQDEYNRTINNPFRKADTRRVLRLDVQDNMVELVSNYIIGYYLVRYLSKPNPIILEDLFEDLSINGINVKTECSLSPALHRYILERAVQMAVRSRGINAKKENV